MRRTTKFEIRARAARLGMTCETLSPGDGKTRYEFTEPKGRVVGFCLGMREAEVFLRGWKEGRRADRLDETPDNIKDFVRSQEPIVLDLKIALERSFQEWAHKVVGLGNGEYGDAVILEAIRRFAKHHQAI